MTDERTDADESDPATGTNDRQSDDVPISGVLRVVFLRINVMTDELCSGPRCRYFV